MELAGFETLNEANAAIAMLAKLDTTTVVSKYPAIDGTTTIGRSRTEWFLTNPTRKISFPIAWAYLQPDFTNSMEFCLSLQWAPGTTYYFNDNNCESAIESFICQRLNYKIILG